MPEISAAVAADSEARLVLVVAKGSPVDAAKLLKAKNINAPLLVANPAHTKKLDVLSVPVTIIVGRDGKERKRVSGFHNKDQFSEYLKY